MQENEKINPISIEFTELEKVDKPPIVYKYRTWNKNVYHDSVLLKNHIYMSAPTDFEDKFDCKNPIRWDLLTPDETKIWLEKKIRETHPKFNDKAIAGLVEHYYLRNGFQDKAYMSKMHAQEWDSYNRLAGVLSLSINPLSLDLWKKYGDNHAGITYGFDTNILIRSAGIGGGGLVNYVDNLPIIHPFDTLEQQVFTRVFYKTKDWTFEEEYRLRTFSNDSRVRTFADQALVEVILGKDFNMEQLPVIKEQLKSKGGHAKLYQVNVSEGILARAAIEY